MIFLGTPHRDDLGDYDRVSQTRREKSARETLARARSSISAAYLRYAQHSGDPTHILPIKWPDALTPTELKANYDALGNLAVQDIRADLFARAPHGRCLLCGLGQASTLDHYLPKSRFPEYSVLGQNLIPCCPQCNLFKGNHYLSSSGSRFLHSYFDKLNTTPLLQAHVTFLGGRLQSIHYSIADHDTIPPHLISAARHHFFKLSLDRCYRHEAIMAMTEIEDVRNVLAEGAREIQFRAILERQSLTLKTVFGVNNWKVALLTALLSNSDYCGG
jgi:hypothetical protein